MKYHQLEAFYQVMLTGSITKAAKNLGRTQPAISMTISSLEDMLGTTLFDRQAGKIVPRSEAHVLFEQVTHVMKQMGDIKQRFGRLGSIQVPRISIISSNNVGTHLVPSAVGEIAASGQELRLMNASSATILSELENQRHDIGVTDEGTVEVARNSPLFEVEEFRIPVCAIFPKGLITSDKQVISMPDLAGHQLCTLYEDNLAVQDLKNLVQSPRMEFSSFFPMACYAIGHGAIAIADMITCKTIQALTSGTLEADWRLIGDAPASPYYLLRPRYRPRSVMVEKCYNKIRAALESHQTYRTP